MASTIPRQQRWAIALTLACLIVATVLATSRAWLSDDAFISFRYAKNLVRGNGLVFNAGERVEGYTNFLWTLLIAAGLKGGVPAEIWSKLCGIAFYVGSIGVLALYHLRLRRLRIALPVPVAAIAGTAHNDWSIFATGGLETALFTFLVLSAFVVLVESSSGSGERPALAGLLMVLATLTRPDGVLFAGIGGLFVLWTASKRTTSVLRYVGTFAVIYVPYTLWRLSYYGDFFANTYYAKSAYAAWWEQGSHYVGLYFAKYWVLGLSLLALPRWLSRWPRARQAPVAVRDAILATAFAIVYTVYVARVGGDFMYARFLIPATPFYLVLFELGLARFAPAHTRILLALASILCIFMVVTPTPVTGTKRPHGIANERDYYNPALVVQIDRLALILGKYLSDLPVTLAFMGAEARVMYKADIPIAIESTTGLTDRFIAHQEIQDRTWAGHEKRAPVPYLIRQRKAHFAFGPRANVFLELDHYIPINKISIAGIQGFILHWDPRIMAELERRGAHFPSIERQIDAYTTEIERRSIEDVEQTYARLELFYFEHVNDSARERAFLDVIEGRDRQ